jgi:hypothetical protein
MEDVAFLGGEKIVDAEHIVPFGDEALTKMGT